MIRARGLATAAVMSAALVACGFLKKPGAGDAGGSEAEASVVLAPIDAATSATTPPAAAANVAQVTRYPGEKAEGGQLTTEGTADLRTAVGPGADLILILKHGTEVEKVAEYLTYYLILADDPKDAARKLLGWVPAATFAAPGTHGGTVPVVGDGGVKPVIAGDAGTKPAAVDAGTKPPGPAKPLDVKKASSGDCPAGYGSCGVICRETCKVEADCGGISGARCFAGFCLGPGAQPCK